MRKCTIEDEKRLMPFVEEAIRDIEKNGTMPIEDFWKRLDEVERKEENQMKKLSQEDIEIFTMLAEEAERDIEENGTYTEEEFWKLVEEDERREKLYKKRNIIKLNMEKCLEKISKRSVRV